MSHTVFSNGVTLSDAAWFNDADSTTYVNFGDGTSYTGFLTTTKINTFTQSTGSFTVTLTGVTTTVTGTAYYSLSNNTVVLDIPALTGTSNSTACTITGLPSAIQPISTKTFTAITEDNTSAQLSIMQLAGGGGTLTLWRQTTPVATFTSSGTKGLGSGASISYTLN